MTIHTDQLARRVIAQAMLDGEAATWERHAALLRWALPRPEDFRGRLETDEDRRRRWHDLSEAIRACEARAAVCRRIDAEDLEHAEAEVAEVLGWSA